MTGLTRREILEAVRPRYLKASKAGKGHILDEFVATTGYHPLGLRLSQPD